MMLFSRLWSEVVILNRVKIPKTANVQSSGENASYPSVFREVMQDNSEFVCVKDRRFFACRSVSKGV